VYWSVRIVQHNQQSMSHDILSIYINAPIQPTSTCDHIHKKISDPVRSPVIKLVRGRLVVGSVTTSEYRLLHVFYFFFALFPPRPP
jgi:hypothetical protein